MEGDKTIAEPFAEEAKYFTEVRLLQRDVKIILEGASNQNLLGTVIHPVKIIQSCIFVDSYAAHCCMIIHRESKKCDTQTITLSIVDRFAKLFYCCKEW